MIHRRRVQIWTIVPWKYIPPSLCEVGGAPCNYMDCLYMIGTTVVIDLILLVNGWEKQYVAGLYNIIINTNVMHGITGDMTTMGMALL